ncbi:MAG: hypothetical protein V3V00_11605 [Saprospiraceae bacterium]
MNSQIDIQENEILSKYEDVLDVLLIDHTTKTNILWATNNYSNLGKQYSSNSEISPNLITGANGNIIMPRAQKDKLLQQSRSRNMAEVFTPSWICNVQNNQIDNAWFNRDNVFNKEIVSKNGERKWEVSHTRITFPKDKDWKKYIRDRRLEMACGEAPYITSRYDTTTGEFISVKERIGIIDRKLRVINENVNTTGEWLKAAQDAFQSTYAYEWQGDNLLLAREAMLFSFIENYRLKFDKEPLVKSIKYIAYIILHIIIKVYHRLSSKVYQQRE